jgi:dienelactone hydrolase
MVTLLCWHDEDESDHGVRQRRFDVVREDRTIPGLLWTPSGDDARALVLVGHGASRSKRQDYVLRLARLLARRHGIASAAIDGPVHGDRRRGRDAPPALVMAEFAQLWATDGEGMTDALVGDWRATLDALQQVPDVGLVPVGWWGLSLGTIIGLPLVAAERRIRAAVLGLMGLTGPTRARIEADAPQLACPVLFMVQWDDALFPRTDALALFEAIGSADKRLLAYPGGHGDVPGEGFDTTIRFLVDHLTGRFGGGTPAVPADTVALLARQEGTVRG